MADCTHSKAFAGETGLYVGAAGSEILVAGATGNVRQVITVPIGAVTATTKMCAMVAPCAGTIESVKLVNSTAITKNDTNYWTFTITNKGAAGDGTAKAAEINTKATGGSAITAYVPLAVTVDTAKNTLAAGDTVLATITKAVDATALAETLIQLEFKPS